MKHSAAEAVSKGACPRCTTEGAIFWHTPKVCERDWAPSERRSRQVVRVHEVGNEWQVSATVDGHTRRFFGRFPTELAARNQAAYVRARLAEWQVEQGATHVIDNRTGEAHPIDPTADLDAGVGA